MRGFRSLSYGSVGRYCERSMSDSTPAACAALVDAPQSPTVYALRQRVPRLGWAQRLVAGVIAAACLAVLGVALWLEPAHRGTGSHEAMGFAPCQFLQR